MDPLVTNVVVTETVQLGDSLQPQRFKRVMFRVGPNGPFSLIYPLNQFSAERVQKDIQAEVDTLRAAGALPEAPPA